MPEGGTLFQLDIPVRRLRPIRGSTLERMTPFLREQVTGVMHNSTSTLHIKVSSVKTFKEFAISEGAATEDEGDTFTKPGFGLACHECESLIMCRINRTRPLICPGCYATGLITDDIGVHAITNPAFNEGEYALGRDENPRALLHGHTLRTQLRLSTRPYLRTNPKAPCVVDYKSYNVGEAAPAREDMHVFIQSNCPNCMAYGIHDELVGAMCTDLYSRGVNQHDFWAALAAQERPKEFEAYVKGLPHKTVGTSKTLREIRSLDKEGLRGVVPTKTISSRVNTNRLASGIKRQAMSTLGEFILGLTETNRTSCVFWID